MAVLAIDSASPAWMHAAADALLFLHIGGGGVALAAGTAAVAFAKGSTPHRVAGHAFFVSMLVMSGIGAAVAPFLPERITSFAGFFTFYLVATAWATVRRPEGRVGRFETIAFFAGTGVAVAGVVLGRIAAGSAGGTLDGLSYQIAFAFAGIAGLAAAGDLSVILRGGISGAPRIARHLWRMCLAFFIASGSFFFGQQQVLPDWLRGSPLQFALGLAPLGFLFFWLAVVYLTKRFRTPRPA